MLPEMGLWLHEPFATCRPWPCAVALRTLYADRHQQPKDFRSSHSIPNMIDGVTMSDSKVPAYRMSFCCTVVLTPAQVSNLIPDGLWTRLLLDSSVHSKSKGKRRRWPGSEITCGPCIIYYLLGIYYLLFIMSIYYE